MISKKYLRLFFVVFCAICVNGSHAMAYEQQWFSRFTETLWAVSAQCTQQCFLIWWEMAWSDFASIKWNITGTGKVVIWAAVGWQVLAIAMQNVAQPWAFSFTTDFAAIPPGQKIPAGTKVVAIFDWTMTLTNITFVVGSQSLFTKFANGIKQASSYVAYSPRTINFMEGPMRNGDYINKKFMWIIYAIVWWAIIYMIVNPEKRKKWIYGIIVGLACLWGLFDMFSSVQQFKLYQHVTSASNIMGNARMW